MYAGHFAAGLAIRTAAPRAPMPALMAAIFVPDLVWLGLSVGGIETVTPPGQWFDGWSHSVAAIVVQAMLAGALCWRWGRAAALAVGGAVLSHLVLDLPMHPAPLQLYPHAAVAVGDVLDGWARVPAPFGRTNGWWVEAVVVLAGLALYLAGRRRIGIGRASAWAGAILVLSLQLAFG